MKSKKSITAGLGGLLWAMIWSGISPYESGTTPYTITLLVGATAIGLIISINGD